MATPRGPAHPPGQRRGPVRSHQRGQAWPRGCRRRWHCSCPVAASRWRDAAVPVKELFSFQPAAFCRSSLWASGSQLPLRGAVRAIALCKGPQSRLCFTPALPGAAGTPALPHPGSGSGGFAPQLPISPLAAAQVIPRAGWERLHPPSLLGSLQCRRSPHCPAASQLLHGDLGLSPSSRRSPPGTAPAVVGPRPQPPRAAGGQVRHRETRSRRGRALGSAAAEQAGKGTIANQPLALPVQAGTPASLILLIKD